MKQGPSVLLLVQKALGLRLSFDELLMRLHSTPNHAFEATCAKRRAGTSTPR